MNTLTIAIILTTIAVVIATLLPTYILSKKKATTDEDWAIASRELPFYVVVGTQFASVIGGGVMVGHVGNAYAFGIGHVAYGICMVLPLLVLMILARWLRKNQFSTVPDIIKHYTGGGSKALNIMTAIATMFFPFGWITSQITAFASIYTELTGLDYTMLCVIFAVLSLLFVMPAGLKTVAWTDFIFGCFILGLMLIIVISSTGMIGGLEGIKASVEPSMLSMSESLSTIGANTVVLWIFSILPGGVTNQIYYQRICAIKDEKKLNLSQILACITSFIAFAWAVYMGILIKGLNPNLPSSAGATGWLMTQLPIPITACFCAALFAAMMSTVSSGVQSIVVNITRDIVPEVKPDISEKASLTLSRVLSFALLALSLMMCLFFTDTLTWLVATAGLSASMLLCPIFFTYFVRKKQFVTNAAILGGMVFGAIGGILGMILHTTINYAALGILFSLIAMIVISIATKKTSPVCHE